MGAPTSCPPCTTLHALFKTVVTASPSPPANLTPGHPHRTHPQASLERSAQVAAANYSDPALQPVGGAYPTSHAPRAPRDWSKVEAEVKVRGVGWGMMGEGGCRGAG